jgi:hypothetical protein
MRVQSFIGKASVEGLHQMDSLSMIGLNGRTKDFTYDRMSLSNIKTR